MVKYLPAIRYANAVAAFPPLRRLSFTAFTPAHSTPAIRRATVGGAMAARGRQDTITSPATFARPAPAQMPALPLPSRWTSPYAMGYRIASTMTGAMMAAITGR